MNTPILVVASVGQSIAWYQETLGFELLFPDATDEVSEGLTYAVLGNDVGAIHLGQDIAMEQTAGQGGFEMPASDFDTIYQRAKAADVSFYFEISLNPVGLENFAILDPDGNRIIVVREE